MAKRARSIPHKLAVLAVFLTLCGVLGYVVRSQEQAGKKAIEPPGYKELMERGRALAKEGRMEEAMGVFEQATASNPSAATPWANLGTIEAKRGSFARAEVYFREAAARDPFHWDIQKRLAEVLVDRGKYGEAAAMARRMIDAAPDDRTAQDLLARALMKLQAWQSILDQFLRPVREEEKVPRPVLWGAVVNAFLGQERFDDATQVADLVVRRFPNHARAYYLRGFARREKARSLGEEPPSEDFERAVALGMTDEYTLDQLAEIQYSAGDLEGLRDTLAKYPLESDRLLYWEALVSYAKDSFEEASTLLRVYVEHVPDDPDGWLWLARALLRAGDMEGAASASARHDEVFSYQVALRDSYNVMAQQNIPEWVRHVGEARVHRRYGAFDDAFASLRLAQELVGAAPPITAEVVKTLLAAGRVEEASRAAAQGRAQWPDDPDIRSAWEKVVAEVSGVDLPPEEPSPVARPATWPFPIGMYVGTEACAECHIRLTEKFVNNARHARSVRPATPGAFPGDLTKGYSHTIAGVTYRYSFDVHDGQVDLVRSWQDGTRSGENRIRIDYIVGTGKQGQSFWSWPSSLKEVSGPDPLRRPSFHPGWVVPYVDPPQEDNVLVQLPLSYYTPVDKWMPSPSGQALILNKERFALRIAEEKCVQCHAGYLNTRARGLFGVDVLEVGCEACHGPGKDHIEYWRARPERTAAYKENEVGSGTPDPTTFNPAYFSLEVRSDVCARCHNNAALGAKVPPGREAAGAESPYFLFRPGDRLEDAFHMTPSVFVEQHTEKETLERSRCFQMSPGEMTCETCHPPHHDPPDALEFTNQACVSCHNAEHGSLATVWGLQHFSDNPDCVSCHMRMVDVSGTFGHGTFVDHEIVRFLE